MGPASIDSDGDGLINRFETKHSHTDPLLADTDHDAILDGREDPDGDGLSNVWEQRLKLNPLRRDSDGDGIPDGAEDNDHDGLTNKFEIHGKVSDPLRNDSDGDGVRDSAEDPDGDLLSNRGEQRLGTHPGKADTNGNGVPDGAEDANHNGVNNALEQDVRPVPTVLTPSLAHARHDLAQTYADGCNGGPIGPYRFPACRYGNEDAAVQVALVGDSHASHWFPAMLGATAARGWRLDNYTRSACPWADVITHSAGTGGVDADCAQFRRDTWGAIAASVPTIVILTSRDLYPTYDQNDQPIQPANYEGDWDAGMARALAQLGTGSILMVLEDSPYPRTIDVRTCLIANRTSIAACEGSRAAWISQSHADAERATALANGARFGSLNDKVCPYDPCGVVFDEILAYRDESHLTAVFSASVAPSMGALLDSVLAP